ncbi:flagellar protein FliS [Photobacterium damselae]|uniref:flagellar protein FliS n=1 Tax=Photobacterium damselae TaxID=38293 RepID=UPI001F2876F8|nr:flagellar protein FliS [Photobacterium damselae]UKA04606.1 flagellar protein FliS [Photobacterium damselae subsp. damselae]
MKRPIRKNSYKKASQSELQGLTQYALTMKLMKEMLRRLEQCEFAFKSTEIRKTSKFFEIKCDTLGRVIRIARYLIDTTDVSADQEIGELFIKMYTFVYVKTSDANISVSAHSLFLAKDMVIRLIDIWNSIPEKDRV